MAGYSIRFLLLALALGLGAPPGGAAAPAESPRGEVFAGQEPSDDYQPDIVVNGLRERSPLADVAPETVYGREELTALGADSLATALGMFGSRTRGSSGGAPIVLLNGRRISGFDEIQSLPPEAVARVEVFPEEVALRYGYGAGMRVVNVVLLPEYRTVTAQAEAGAATAGGFRTGRAESNVWRIRDTLRWNADLRLTGQSRLLESERAVRQEPGAADAARFRTLVPAQDGVTLRGSVSGFLPRSVSSTLSVEHESRDTSSLLGVGALLPDGRPITAIGRETEFRRSRAAATFSGGIGRWVWSLGTSYNSDLVRSATDSEGRPVERTRSRSRAGGAELVFYGPLTRLPAGPLSASITAAVQETGFRSAADSSPTAARIDRTRTSLQLNFDAPLLDPASGSPVGKASLTFSAAASRLSEFGTIRRLHYGANWSPFSRLHVSASITDEERAPSPQELAEPLLLTPGVRIFDYTAGETTEVTRITGGNGDLAAGERRLLRLGFSFRPLPAKGLFLRSDYVHTRDRNLPAPFPLVSSGVESAFPERFTRDATGRLVRIDARPVNLARADRKELRSGLHHNFPLRNASGRNGNGDLSLFHLWHLRDRVQVRPDLPSLDFLNGAPLPEGRPRSRHGLEFQAGLYQSGIGARLSGDVQSAARLDSGAGAIRFSPYATANLRVFIDLGQQRSLAAANPWVRDTRVSLAVTNLFDARQQVRDRSGTTPLAFQPALLDPIGRTVTLTLRKLFT